METIDPKAIKVAKASVRLYLLGTALAVFGAFMFWVFISKDLARQNTIAPAMAALWLCCVAIAACAFYTAIQYWQDGGRRGPHDRRGINGRSAVTGFMALGAAAAAYAYYPLPFPSAAERISGTISHVVVDDDSVVTKLDFRVLGQPFGYDCFHKKGQCPQRDAILALAKHPPRVASVIPVDGTVLSLEVDGKTIVDEARERASRAIAGIEYLVLALFLGAVAWGDWRGYRIFRKPLQAPPA